MDAQTTLDRGEVESFALRMITALDGGSVALLVSLGHQAGLFEVMATLPPSTSAEIAAAAGLHERYVRECLDGLVAADVVGHDPAGGRYRLPAEHALLLTRAGGADNLAPTMQLLALMGGVEQQVLGCLRHGGGLPYAAYPRVQPILAESAAAFAEHVLVERLLPLVDGLPARLAAGADAADLGCGSGHAVNALATTYPASRFTGFDLDGAALDAARADAERQGLTNVSFVEQDVATLAHHDAFDLVTAFDAIHDQARPRAVLAAMHRALRPGGVLLVRDIKASSQVENNRELPWASFLYAMSTFHCMSVSLAAGGEGLGTAWGEELALELFAEAGFPDVTVTGVDGDPLNNCYVAVKEALT
jgi:ubiquinone/menaquinone biosynthesis C-methylase UbiE